MAHRRRYSECGYLRIGLVRRAHPVHLYSTSSVLNQGFPCLCRQKNTRKGISWSARAASRWILEKLKEDKEHKVLRVQASNETLEGSGSKDLVGVVGYSLYHYLGAEAHHDLCFIQQPDRNTENDISIRDCCRYFRRNTRDPVFLLSGDVNLSIRGESDRRLLM